MTSFPTLDTRRLHLRPWRAEDLVAFAALNADPRVMECMPKCLTRVESDQLADRIAEHFRLHGFGLWALEVPGETPFAGFVGLAMPRFEAPFTPCVEIGWRLAYAQWGRGYATEAASAVRDFAFERLGLEGIVSFTVPFNRRSRRVMEKIGLSRAASEDFDHPALPEGHPLRRHVLYRLRRADWRALKASA